MSKEVLLPPHLHTWVTEFTKRRLIVIMEPKQTVSYKQLVLNPKELPRIDRKLISDCSSQILRPIHAVPQGPNDRTRAHKPAFVDEEEFTLAKILNVEVDHTDTGGRSRHRPTTETYQGSPQQGPFNMLLLDFRTQFKVGVRHTTDCIDMKYSAEICNILAIHVAMWMIHS